MDDNFFPPVLQLIPSVLTESLLILVRLFAGLRVFLVRHGQSLANEDPSFYTKMADHAVPLSDHGRQQAADAGKNLLSVFK